LFEKGEPHGRAKKKLELAFDEMTLLIECLGFLDICCTFEDAFRRRVGTALGEARRAVDSHYNLSQFKEFRRKLLRDSADFDSLAAIISASESLLSPQVVKSLGILRGGRNSVAHGSGWKQPLPLTVEQARDLLIGLAAELPIE
jgi:hypothetical protein